MKTLETEKTWTGDGNGANPIILKQIKRTDTVALYSRQHKDSDKIQGYEVFIIKKRLKGQALPGGLFEEEDREVYPSGNSFGKIAWSIITLERAEAKFNELVASGETVVIESEPTVEETVTVDIDPTDIVSIPKKRGRPKSNKPPVVINFPDGEFTMQEIADFNKMEKTNIYFIVQDFVTKGGIEEVRRESRGQGRPTVIYKKT